MNKPKLSCHHLWKVYGQAARGSARTVPSAIDAEALRAQGAIVAVRDASLEVDEGQILAIMGLSGSGQVHPGSLPCRPDRADRGRRGVRWPQPR